MVIKPTNCTPSLPSGSRKHHVGIKDDAQVSSALPERDVGFSRFQPFLHPMDRPAERFSSTFPTRPRPD